MQRFSESNSDIAPFTVTLKDKFTTATVYPINLLEQVPPKLVEFLSDEFNTEIFKGASFPFLNPLAMNVFSNYWFSNFCAVMVLGDNLQVLDKYPGDTEWANMCLGTFTIKPNYPGRSAHVCSGQFLVNIGARSKGIGKLLLKTFVDWAAKLGYTYCLLDLVYSTNVPMVSLLQSAGFQRVGRIPSGAYLQDDDEAVDILMFGKQLVKWRAKSGDRTQIGAAPNLGPNTGLGAGSGAGTGAGDNNAASSGSPAKAVASASPPATIKEPQNISATITQANPDGTVVTFQVTQADSTHYERIKEYLLSGKYPQEANKAERSKIRSRSTNYSIVEGKLMLKKKEVIIDPKQQLEIVNRMHLKTNHGGINKTTAAITEKYHWSRIKHIVMQYLKNCAKCSDTKGADDKKRRQKRRRAVQTVAAVAAGSENGPEAGSEAGDDNDNENDEEEEEDDDDDDDDEEEEGAVEDGDEAEYYENGTRAGLGEAAEEYDLDSVRSAKRQKIMEIAFDSDSDDSEYEINNSSGIEFLMDDEEEYENELGYEFGQAFDEKDTDTEKGDESEQEGENAGAEHEKLDKSGEHEHEDEDDHGNEDAEGAQIAQALIEEI